MHWFTDEIGDNWYYLGVELLANQDVPTLNTLRNDYPMDSKRCCSEMFQLWLKRHSSVKWREVITALRNIGQVHLAEKIPNEVYSM